MKPQEKPKPDEKLAQLLKIPAIPEMTRYRKTWAWKKPKEQKKNVK